MPNVAVDRHPEHGAEPPLVPEIRLDLPARLQRLEQSDCGQAVLRSAMQAGPAGLSEEAALWRIVRSVYDIEADDRRLHAGTAAGPKTRDKHFEQLRKNYPIRRELRFTRVALAQGHPRLESKMHDLGFMI